MKRDYVLVPAHYSENLAYAATILEASDVVDRLNAPPLRTLQKLLEQKEPDAKMALLDEILAEMRDAFDDDREQMDDFIDRIREVLS